MYLGNGIFTEVSFKSFSSSADGGIINGRISTNNEIEIKGCTFTSCSSSGKGGAIYVELNGGGTFSINNNDSIPTTFKSCITSESGGKGGGIYLKLESEVTSGFSFSGGLSFTDCSASVGSNIYIKTDNLNDAISSSAFTYNYVSSLQVNSNELYGSKSSSDINLRKYLCPLTFDSTSPQESEFNCKAGCIEFDNSECVIDCTYPNLLRIGDNRFCDILPCDERNINDGCFEGCVKDGQLCSGECSNSYHYENVSGVCTLISDCTKRKVDLSKTGFGEFLCGSESCYAGFESVDGSNCVSSCGDYFHIDGEECKPDGCDEISIVSAEGCSHASACYYKEVSEVGSCVSSCGDYFLIDGQECKPVGCSDITNPNAGRCSHVSGCYYNEVSNDRSCVNDCGVDYDSDDNFGLCILKENPNPNSENQLFPSYLLFIIIGAVLLIIIIIVISLIVFKVRSKKDSFQYIFYIFFYLYLF
jgi:hypothetical protein